MKELNLEKYKTLAERYTKALVKTTQDNNEFIEIGNELENINEIFIQKPEIMSFFTNPIIKNEDKKDVLQKSFGGKINTKLYNFLNILLDKNRIFILPNINSIYKNIISERQNVLVVNAFTAIPLNSDIENLLRTKLHQITGKNIKVINNIEKDIIGGMILKIQGKVIDGSIRTQIKNLQKQLI